MAAREVARGLDGGWRPHRGMKLETSEARACSLPMAEGSLSQVHGDKARLVERLRGEFQRTSDEKTARRQSTAYAPRLYVTWTTHDNRLLSL